MPIRDKTRRALEDCIEKADKLREMRLDEHILQVVKGFRGHRLDDDEWSIEFDLPESEKGEASLLTFRLFLQHNEDYSFEQMRYLIADPELSETFRSQMAEARQAYFELVNRHPVDVQADFFEEGEHPTWGDILIVVMNGALAHTNDLPKRRKFKHWTRDGIRKNVLLQRFWLIVGEVLQHICWVSDLCKQELQQQGLTGPRN